MLTKLTIFNFMAFCALFAATWQGHVMHFFTEDVTYISYAIFALFLYGLAQIFWFASGMVKENVLLRFKHVADIATYLPGLGVIGTALGIYISMKAAEVGADATQVQDFVTTVLSGTKSAFGATIVAITLYVWHHINCRIVHTQLMISASEKFDGR